MHRSESAFAAGTMFKRRKCGTALQRIVRRDTTSVSLFARCCLTDLQKVSGVCKWDPIFEAFKFIFLFCRSMYRAELLYGVRALHASRRGSKVSCIRCFCRALIILPNKHLTRVCLTRLTALLLWHESLSFSTCRYLHAMYVRYTDETFQVNILLAGSCMKVGDSS